MKKTLLFAAAVLASVAWADLAAADTVNVTWTNPRQVSVSGSSLSKSGGGDAWNAGASATQALTSGAGYFEFTATAADKLVSAGLSESDLSLDPFDPRYSIQLTAAGNVTVVESGTLRGTYGSFSTGDVFRIDVASNGTVTYLKNSVSFYTSTVAAKYPLQPDVAFYTAGGGADYGVLSGTLGIVVSWAGPVGVGTLTNNVTKTVAGTAWDAGAVSTQAIASGDGAVEFVATGGLSISAGLGNGDANQSYTDIEFGLRLGTSSVNVYESGTNRGSFGSYAAEDRFKVAVVSGAVKYYKNGTLLYTSGVTPSYPLLVDTSISALSARVGAVTLTGTLQAVGVEPPQLSIPGGNYSATQTVVITDTTAGATIYYTTNGAEPTQSDSIVTSGDSVTVDHSLTLKAKAWATGLTASVTTAASYAIGGVQDSEPVIWTNLVKAVAIGNSLMKTATTNSVWDAGGISVQQITHGDGYVEVTTGSSTLSLFGLGNGDADQGKADVDFAFQFNYSNFTVYELGAARGSTQGYSSGDVFRIGIESGVVKYRRNGVLVYTSAMPPQFPLTADSSIAGTGFILANAMISSGGRVATPTFSVAGGNYASSQTVVVTDATAGATIHYTTNAAEPTESDSVVASGGSVMVDNSLMLKAKAFASGLSPSATALASYAIGVQSVEPVIWTNVVNAVANGNSLTKTAGPHNVWDAGGISVQQITQGDGYVEVTMGIGTISHFGLGNGDLDQGLTDVEYAIQFSYGAFTPYESGAPRGSYQWFASGDVFRIGVESGVVKYRRNGVVFYTSATPPQYPLTADSSIAGIGSTLANAMISSGGRVAAPTFSVAGGNYASSQTVVVTDATAGATIYYTTNGAEPAQGDAVVASGDSLTVDHSLTLKAKAFASGLYPSATATASYAIGTQTAEPVIWTNVVKAVANGNSLTKTATTNNVWDAGGISVQQIAQGDGYVEVTMGVSTLSHFGLGNGDVDQGVTDVEYALQFSYSNFTVFEYGAARNSYQSFAAGDVFRIGVESGVVTYRRNGTLFYTSTMPPQYPLTADSSIAGTGSTLGNAMISSGGRATTPTFSVAAGNYASAQAVVVSDATAGATIHYTTNGAEPTEADPVVSSGSAVTVDHSLMLKVKAFASGLYPSATATASYSIGVQVDEPVFWTNVVNASANGNTLTKTGTSGSWDAGGVSVQEIVQGDGYVEATGITAGGQRAFGLDNGDTDQGLGDIAFGFYLNGNNYIVYELGAQMTSNASITNGDVFRVGVEGGVVKYRRNGAVVYTSLKPLQYPLHADAAILTAGAKILNAGISSGGHVATPTFSVPGGNYASAQSVVVSDATSGATIYYTTNGAEPTQSDSVVGSGGTVSVTEGMTLQAKAWVAGLVPSATMTASYAIGTPTAEPVVWTSLVNASAPGSTLTKTGTTSSWDAGGVSVQKILQGDGYVEVTGETGSTGQRAFGLGYGDSDQSLADIEFAIYLNGSNYYVDELGGQLLGPVGYSNGDVFRVAVESGVVKYSRNGTVFFTSTMPPRYPMVADASILTSTARVYNAVISGIFVAQAPGFSPASGTYTSAQSVAMTTTTSAAEIRYTTDGSEPTASSTLYTGPVSVGTTTVLKAKAFKTGYVESATTTGTYQMDFGTLSAPTISPAGGSFTDSVSVTLSSSQSGATIRYTTDGSDPTGSSTLYTSALTFSVTTTLKAKAFHFDYTTSSAVAQTFMIVPAQPTFDPDGGSYMGSVVVTVATTTSGATVRYTTNGGDPTASDPAVTGGTVTLTATGTLKARAFKSGCDASPVKSADFEVSNIKAVAAAGRHALVLKPEGTVWTWGDASYGAVNPRLSPVQVTELSSIVAIAAGRWHSLALTNDGVVKAWGYNGYGQLGRGNTTDSSVPVTVTLLQDAAHPELRIVSIAGSEHSSFAARSDGKVFAWGNGYGSTPVELAGVTGAVKVVGGDGSGFALKGDGTAMAWGYNPSGQLCSTGNPGPSSVLISPVKALAAGHYATLAIGGLDSKVYGCVTGITEVGLPNSRAIAAGLGIPLGSGHYLVADVDGQVWSWGGNNAGQLGDGTLTNQSTPQQIAGLTDISYLAAGDNFSVAMSSSGEVWTWGGEGFNSGQNGNGVNTGSRVPEKIAAAGFAWMPSVPVFSPAPGTFGTPQDVTITAAAGAEVHYTTDGSEPSVSSPTYTAPLAVGVTTPLKARAFRGTLGGHTASGTYTLQVTTVVVSPAAGTYFTPQTVTITDSTPGASLYYTTNGVDPTASDTSITSGGTISVNETLTLKVRAFKSGWADSLVKTAPYSIQVSPITASPAAGTYTSPVDVALSTTTSGATIRYTLDGSAPTATSTAYSTPLHLDHAATLRAAGFQSGWTTSVELLATYFVSLSQTAATPAFLPTPGTFSPQATVTITSATSDATIRYTLDGTEPTVRSRIYSAPIELWQSATVKAKAFKVGYLASSTATGDYVIDTGGVATPALSPGGGSYTVAVTATASCATSGATIRYTSNGGDPTESDPVFAPETIIDTSRVVKLRAFASGLAPSAVRTAVYSITGAVAAAGNRSLALSSQGTVWGWGAGGSSTPVQITTHTDVIAVAATGGHDLLVLRDGTVWQAPHGQPTATPAPVKVASGVALSGIIAVEAASVNMQPLALTSAGTVWTWDPLNPNLATQVAGLEGITAIGVADQGTYAALQTYGAGSGVLWMWGSNSNGQFGISPALLSGSTKPVAVLADVTAVGLGVGFSLAARADGTVVSAGSNAYGNLGDGTLTSRPSWAPVVSLQNALALRGGHFAALALTPDRMIRGWGNNVNGSVGTGLSVSVLVPVPLTPGGMVAMASGWDHSLGLRGDGTVWSWGPNASGSNGTGASSLAPVKVTGFTANDSTWLSADTDGDGLSNGLEAALGSDPTSIDTNGDGLLDGAAYAAGRSLTDPDTDHDGLANVAERALGTNPLRADTDGDGVNDGPDCFPLDPAQSACPTPTSGDTTPPVITLTEPVSATLISSLP